MGGRGVREEKRGKEGMRQEESRERGDMTSTKQGPGSGMNRGSR